MAYVGTPKKLGSPIETIASILTGESSTPNGRRAVLNVMINRASENFSNYGTTVLEQALAPMQFQGQTIPPDKRAWDIANEWATGKLPSIVGNALYYAAPQGTTAKWALDALAKGQGIRVGGNYFWADDKGTRPTVDWDDDDDIVQKEPTMPIVKNGNTTIDLGDFAAFLQRLLPVALNVARIIRPGSGPVIDALQQGLGELSPPSDPSYGKTMSAEAYKALDGVEKDRVLAAGYRIV